METLSRDIKSATFIPVFLALDEPDIFCGGFISSSLSSDRAVTDRAESRNTNQFSSKVPSLDIVNIDTVSTHLAMLEATTLADLFFQSRKCDVTAHGVRLTKST
jgi:hypothetical protein